jgi:putative glycosyltransferase (TIGR04348 family)
MRTQRLKIALVTPAPPHSRVGNRVTAQRWARILRQLGHAVTIVENYQGRSCDLLLALHARKSHPSILHFREQHPSDPLVVALTGTDLYGDIQTDAAAQQSLELADRLIVLQPLGVKALPRHVRAKARVIFQSVPTPRVLVPPRSNRFEVCVIGHLRPIKDPFRTAYAARLLPESSRLKVLQLGQALSDEMARQACAEAESNPRYRWLGEWPRWRTLRLLSRCRLLVLTSKMEGGANVIGEALACSVPVLSSHIAGSVGILGDDYPGYFPCGDTEALTRLLHQAETDEAFYQELKKWCAERRLLFEPQREVESWKKLLAELHEE